MFSPCQIPIFALVILLATFGGGVPLGMVQLVADATMLVSFSKSQGLSESIEKTFDGEHPCTLCRFVAQAQEQEEDRPDEAKFDRGDQQLPFLAAEILKWTSPAGNFSPHLHASTRRLGWVAPPATPPPRGRIQSCLSA